MKDLETWKCKLCLSETKLVTGNDATTGWGGLGEVSGLCNNNIRAVGYLMRQLIELRLIYSAQQMHMHRVRNLL